MRDPDQLLYLAYGSNLHVHRLNRRVPSARPLGPARLDGWALEFHKVGADGSGKCNLVPSTGAVAHGVVYELTVTEKPHLDAAESLGVGYDLAWLELDGFGRVFTYLARAEQIRPGLEPFAWYKRYVVEGARHHRLPGDYLARLESIPDRFDPDPRRNTLNQGIFEGRFDSPE